MTEHHYFATFAMGWATAPTRDEAIRKLVNGFRRDIKTIVKNTHKAGEAGMYVWTVKVNAAADADYKIEWYMPKGVDIEDAKEHYVTYVTDKEVAYWTDKNAEKAREFDATKKRAAAKAKLAAYGARAWRDRRNAA